MAEYKDRPITWRGRIFGEMFGLTLLGTLSWQVKATKDKRKVIAAYKAKEEAEAQRKHDECVSAGNLGVLRRIDSIWTIWQNMRFEDKLDDIYLLGDDRYFMVLETHKVVPEYNEYSGGYVLFHKQRTRLDITYVPGNGV